MYVLWVIPLPMPWQIKCSLVLHLISAAFATAALGLMSKHLPYRQDSYHCEHCRRLELHAVVANPKGRSVLGCGEASSGCSVIGRFIRVM